MHNFTIDYVFLPVLDGNTHVGCYKGSQKGECKWQKLASQIIDGEKNANKKC